MSNKFNKLFFKKKKIKKVYLYYTFFFISLITPYKVFYIRFFFIKSQNQSFSTQQKLFVKQSYFLLTWFWYIKLKLNKNSKPSLLKPHFACKPIKKTKITLLKTPMAHKTFSQEQFEFQFFSFVISFKTTIPYLFFYYSLNIFNQVIYFILFIKIFIPFIETNVFLLKRIKIQFTIYNWRYFLI